MIGVLGVLASLIGPAFVMGGPARAVAPVDGVSLQSFHSWINNQSSGTRAEFRNWAHNSIRTTGLPLSDYTDYFKPCN